MRLTPELARQYASYRERFLRGARGIYAGFPTSVPDPCGGGALRQYVAGTRVPFMVVGRDASKAGTFLFADLKYQEPAPADKLEESRSNHIAFGDSTIWTAVAMTSFAAEHAITELAEPLDIVIGILRALQRLGSIRPGLGELGDAPYGFVLRSDSHDWSEGDGHGVVTLNENFCNYGDGTNETAYLLAPSFDQYAGILSSCYFAKRILVDAPATASESIANKRLVAIRLIEERVSRIVEFLAFRTQYTIRWEAGGNIHQPLDRRGPYLHFAALPLARIASLVLKGSVASYGSYLGSVSLPAAAEITRRLIEAVSKGLQQLRNVIKERFQKAVCDAFGPAWETVERLSETWLTQVNEQYAEQVIPRVEELVLDPISRAIQSWNGVPATPLADEALAQLLFDVFVAGTLLDPSGEASRPLTINVSLARLCEIVGASLPTGGVVAPVNLRLLSVQPRWWKEEVLGPFPAPPSWEEVFEFVLTEMALREIEIPIPGTELLTGLISFVEAKSYLVFAAYNITIAADAFELVRGADPIEIADRFDNAWYMALAHRFAGARSENVTVANVLDQLTSAPDTFPNGKRNDAWNQDFRWHRNREFKDANAIYSGMDFMAPLMIACALPEDVQGNKLTLLEALKNDSDDEQEQSMADFVLPFEGEINNFKIFEPTKSGLETNSIVYVAVVFERLVADDAAVHIVLPTLAGGEAVVEFVKSQRCSRVVSAPATPAGVTIKHATASARGKIHITVRQG